jgi:hypothetical protein
MAREHIVASAKTALAILTWIALNEVLPPVTNDVQKVGRTLAGVVAAAVIVELMLTVVLWRPHLRFRVEALYDSGSPVGTPVRSSPFTPPLLGGSAWFLVYVEYNCRGLIAKAMGWGLRAPGTSLELIIEPVGVATVTVEKPSGAEIRSLTQGRRGAVVVLPAPLTGGDFAVFQLEVRPVMQPAPLLLTAKAKLRPKGAGWGRFRLRVARLSCDLREIRFV